MSWRQGERIVGFPSGIWTPRRFANLVQWLDAGRGVTLTSGKVSQWDDLSDNGNHCTQSNAAIRPVMGSTLNNQATIEFTGGNNLIHSLTVQPACTIAFVGVNDTPDNAQYQPIGSWSAGGTHGMYIYAKNPNGGSSPAYQWGSYANGNSDSGATLSTFKKCVVLARAYTDMDFRTNGSSVTSATGVSGYNGGAFLGYTGGAQILAGRIAEIICYSRVLSVAECQKIEAYFAAKYGL